MRVLLTRPREQSLASAREFERIGIDVLIEPMLRILPRAVAVPELANAQAVLVTSAYGAARLADLTTARDIPIFAVGDASAETARDRGFADVESAAGAGAHLVRLVAARCDPAGAPLVHVSGDHIAVDLVAELGAYGFQVIRHVLYHAVQAESLSTEVQTALAKHEIDGVLFFSARTAKIFVRLAETVECAHQLAHCAAFCLSEPVAISVKAVPWRRVAVTTEPTFDAMRALVDAARSDG